MESTFARVIEEHLELKRRNAELDGMPLDRYKVDDPFQNHPLFKTEEQARVEDTLDGTVSIVDAEEDLVALHAHSYPAAQPGEGLWSRSRDFDWGD